MVLRWLKEKAISSYRLRKWSKAIKLRDKNTCQMCNRIGTIEAHHIYPKSLYPLKAYDLDNGVSLCRCCHIISVHASNTFDLSNWQKFVPMFRYMMRLVRFKNFNEKYQDRI